MTVFTLFIQNTIFTATWNTFKREALTAVRDVESSAGHRVVGLELQLEDVGVAGEVWRHFCPREASQHHSVRQLPVPHRQEVVGRLQVEVVEGQMDAAARFSEDQPDAVEVVAVTLGIVRRQNGSHGCREVGHTRN